MAAGSVYMLRLSLVVIVACGWGVCGLGVASAGVRVVSDGLEVVWVGFVVGVPGVVVFSGLLLLGWSMVGLF